MRHACIRIAATVKIFVIGLLLAAGVTSASAATYNWINTSGGNWNVAANWSGGPINTVPGASDIAVISATGNYTVTVNNNQSVGTLTLGASTLDGTVQTLNVTGSTLTVNNPSTGTSQGTLTLSGTLGGVGSLTLAGAFNFSGGAILNTGGIYANGTLTISGNPSIGQYPGDHVYGMLVNGGTATWYAGNLTLGGGGVLSNSASGTFNWNTGSTIGASYANNLFANTGQVNVTAGNGTASVNAQFNNSGAVMVGTGALSLNGGGADSDSAGGFTVASGATLNMGGNTYTFNLGSLITGAGNVSVSGGTANFNGTLNVTGNYTVNNSTANFNGAYTIGGTTTMAVNSGTVNFNGPGATLAAFTLNSSTLYGASPVHVPGNFTFNSSTILNTGGVYADGTLTIAGNPAIGRYPGDQIYGVLVNTGTATLSSGGLTLGGGGVFSNSASGTFNWNTGTTIGANYGNNSFANAGQVAVNVGAGTASFNSLLNNSGAGTVTVNTGTLSLNGGGTDSESAGGFTVASGADLNVGGNTYTFNLGSLITGAGNVTMSGGTANFDGTLNVTGNYTINSSTANFNGAYTIGGTTTMAVNSGTVNFNGNGPMLAALTLNSSTLYGASPVHVAGNFTFNSSTVLNTAGVYADGTLTITGNPAIGRYPGDQIYGVLVNTGTATLNSGGMTLGGGGVFSNSASGTFNWNTGTSISANYGNNSFANAGQVVVNVGAGTASLNCLFNNSGAGAVTVSAGTLSLNGGGTDSDSGGGFSVASGADLNVGGSTYTFNLGSLITGAGNVSMSGGTANFNGTLNVTGNYTINSSTANFNGAYTIGGTATMAVNSATVNFNGTGPALAALTLSSSTLYGASPVHVTGNFTFNSSTILNTAGVFADGTLTITGNPAIGRYPGDQIYGVLVNTGTATLSSGGLTLGGGGVFSNSASGTFNWNTGTSIGANYGNNTFANAGQIGVNAGAGTASFNCLFNNSGAGTVTVSTGTLSLNGGGTDSDSGGGFNVASGADLNVGGSSYTFNAGSLITGAGNVSMSGGAGNFNGTMNATGNYTINSSTANFGGSYTIGGSSAFSVGSATVNFNGPGTATPASLTLNSSTLGGAAPVSVSGLLTFNSSTILNTGPVFANGTMTITGNPSIGRYPGDQTYGFLVNNGIATWNTGALTLGGGGVFSNSASGTLNWNSANSLNNNYGNNLFINKGQVNVAVGNGTATVNTTFNEQAAGIVSVNTGTFSLNGGGTDSDSSGGVNVASGATLNMGNSYTFAAGSTIAGPGNVMVSGGTCSFNGNLTSTGTYTVNNSTASFNMAGAASLVNLTLNSCTLNGAAPVNVSGALIFNASTILDATGVTANGTMTITGNPSIGRYPGDQTYGFLVNNGITTWNTGAFTLGGGGVFSNSASGTLNWNSANSLNNSYAGNLFINKGQVNVAVGNGTATVNAPFNDQGAGIVNINTGTFSLNGGGTDSDTSGGMNVASGATLNMGNSYTFAAGSTIAGPGNVMVSGGTCSFNGNLTSTGTYTVNNSTASFNMAGAASLVNLTLNSCTLNGTAPVNVSGSLIFNSSTILDATGVTANGTLTITGNPTIGQYPGDRTYGFLVNNGVTTWNTGAFTLGGGGVFSNSASGALNWNSANSLNNSYAGNLFINKGQVNVAVGNGTATVNAPFNEQAAGIVNVNTGTFSLNGGGTDSDSSGGVNVASGATLNMGNSYTFAAGSTIAGAGNVTVSGGTCSFNGNLTSTGTYTVNNSTASFNVAGAASLVNLTLNSSTLNGSSPVNVSGSLIFNSSTILDATGVSANGTMTIMGTPTVGRYPGDQTYGFLVNNGITTWNTGALTLGGGGVFSNSPSGTLNWNSANPLSSSYAGNLFVNNGQVNVAVGTGTASENAPLVNTGTVTVNNGTLTLGTSRNLSGGTLNFGINSLTSFGQVSLSGAAGFAGTLSATLNNGFVPAIGNQWQLLSYGSSSGSFANTTLPPVATWQTIVGNTALSIRVASLVPTTVWSTPAPITYGTPLSATQLDASSIIAGTFTYNPPAGTVLPSGNQNLSATFTPLDLVDYSPSTVTTTISVQPAPLTITANNASKTYGQTVTFAGTEFTTGTLVGSDTVTSVTLASAGATSTASVSGSPYNIVPSAAAGSGVANYNITYVSGHLTVNKATPTITWANPAYILYPAPLTGVQLDATGSVAGSFVYSPPAGTVLAAGNGQTLSTTFTPSDATDYNTANDSVSINVLSCFAAPSGLTDWWQAEGSALDAIGGDNGTLHGGVTYVAGEVGQAFSFDGSTGWVDIPNTAALNPTGPFTVEFWENGNPSQASAQSLLVDKSHGFVDFTGWLFQTQPGTGQLAFGFGDGSGFPVATSAATILDSQWHHVAGVWTGTEIDIYIDGALQGSTPQTTAPANNARDMEIGSSWGGGTRTRYFNGKIDEVSFYGRALSATEIVGIYTAATAGKCLPAVTVTWPNPADISYGTALGGTQLNATANVAGTFSYTPAAGTIPHAGNNQTVSVTFTPSDTADFAPVTQTASINVQPLPLSITANSTSKIYGQTVGFAGTEFVAAGLINGDTVTHVTLTSTGAAAGAGVGGSPYNIVPSAAVGSGLGNYTVNYVDGNLTVTPATLTITANNLNKVYGSTLAFAGTEFHTTGLQNGETVGTVTLTSGGSPSTAPVSGSPYPIMPSAATGGTFSPANYNIGYVNGQLTVTGAPLTITANSTSKNYGQTVTFAGTEFSTTGLVAGDSVSSVTLASDGAAATGTAGGHNIVPSAAVGTGLANYAITYANGVLTVNPASLTITANDGSKVYGQTKNFAGTEFTSVGLLNSDAIATVRLNSVGAPASAAVAGYSIVPSSAFGTGLNNYTIAYENGTLTVTAAPLTVTADNLTMTQGHAVQTLSVSYSGFVNNDGPSSLNGSPALSTTATSGSQVGPYPIFVTLGTINDPNYSYSFVDGTLTVQQPTLTITANDASMTYGGALPALSVSYSGFVNGDTPASLTTAPSVTTTGSSTAHAGAWPITASGAVDPNYTIVYVPGTLTISPALLTITANDAGKTYGQTKGFAGTEFTAAPLLNGDTIASVTLSSAGAPASAGAGPYSIIPSAATGPRAGNYTITYDNGTLTVNPATLYIAAMNQTKYFGQTFTFAGTEFTTTGLQNGDTVGSVTLTSPGAAPTASVAGSPYPITPSLATGGTFLVANYNITYINASLNVLPVGTVPTISTLLPAAGPIGGGTPVTIIGTGFELGATVMFGGGAATSVRVESSTTLVAATPAAPSGTVDVTVSNPDGNSVVAPSAFSYGIPPTVTTPPSSLTLNQGQTAQFQIAATGDPTLSYQWQYNGANLLESVHNVGTHTTLLTVNSVGGGDTGSYRCVVSNPYESVPSPVATLNVIVPPTAITVSPPNASVGPGGSLTLTASANGTSPTYSWYQGTTLLNGQNGPVLNLANVQAGASYTAVAANAAGSVTSAPVVISVLTYCANVQVAQATYPEGTQFIPLTVQTLNCGNSSPMPNSGAVVWIYTLGTSRALPVTTDASGNGTVEFTPLPVEVGLCQYAVALPGQPAPPASGSFTIIGMNLSQQSESPQLIVGIPQTNTLLLNNLTAVPLTGIHATILGAPSDVDITVNVPDSVPGNGAVQTTYTLSATGTAPSSATFGIQYTSAEGATVTLPFNATMSPLTAQLSANPGSLVGTMIEGSQTLVSFIVSNSGGAPSGPLQVNVPTVGWLSVVTAQPLASLAPNQSAQITLALSPTNGQQLGGYPGELVVQGTNSSVTVPFTFTAVSTLVGNLQVTAQDELSVYGAGNPNLAGATVTVKDFLTGATVGTQVTDFTGVANFTGLTSAYYTVNVQAPNHGNFSTTLLIQANTTTPLIAFLPLQLVDYTWTVTPTVIPDTYDFTLTTVFVTEVPWPVITVSPGSIDLCGIAGDTVQINLVITNSGLIAGEGLQLALDDSNPDWSIVALSTNLGNLAAESSIVVPLTLTRRGTSMDASVPSSIAAAVNWYVAALNRTEYNSTPIFIYNANPLNCNPSVGSSTPVVVPSGGGGTNGAPSPYGQQGYGNSRGFSPIQPVVSQPNYNLPPPASGAIVAVTLQIDQSAVISQNAFHATLNLANNAGSQVTDLQVQINPVDASGNLAGSQFFIQPPLLTGVNAVDGTGTLAVGANGQANWTIIPTTTAAATGTTMYAIGGTLSYMLNGQPVSIPLFAVPITVLPDPKLNLDYFLEHDVYSQDPFTTVVEPPQPFALGLRVRNDGLGTANNFTITSAEPTIINNANGLLINFQLLDSQIGTNNTPVPSFTLNMGNINPGTNVVGIWFMTASLEGDFTNFQASFQHSDALGGTETSVINSVRIHEMNHVVRITCPNDDLIPDFLCNDTAVVDALPNDVYSSDGNVYPVTSLTGSVAESAATISSPVVTINDTSDIIPGGFVYFELPDPSGGQLTITSVTRSDGKQLLIGPNVWQTPVRPHMVPPHLTALVHIFDCDSTGKYNINYGAPATLTWPTPAAITYGTPLGPTQLNATATIPGTFIYTPPAGTVLTPGTQTLSVTFTPTDTAHFGILTASVSLSVLPAGLTIAANNNLTKIYGQTETFAGTEFTATGLVNGDTVTGVTLASVGAPPAAPVAGSPYPVVPSAAVGTGLDNYTIMYVNGSLTVTAAPLAITANNNLTKVYGRTAIFAGTEFTATGLLNGDTVTSVTLNSAGAPPTALVAGSPYPVVPSAAVGTGLNNYTITYDNGALAVTKAPLTVTANSVSRAIGDANPTLSGTITGLQNGDNITASYSTTATPTSPTGPYPIMPHLSDPGGKLPNYSPVINNGTLTVTAGFISLICQPDITVNYNPAICGQMVSFAPVAAGDPTPVLTCTYGGVPITSPYLFPVGTSIVTCTATSAAGTETCSFRVIVIDTNPPLAGPNTLGTYENTSTVERTAKVLLRDSSPIHLPLSIVSVTSPTPNGATVTLGGGQITYLPPTSFIGLDTLTYTLSDGCGTAPGTILVTVLATNLPTQNLESILLGATGRTVVFHGVPNANYLIEAAPSPTGPWSAVSGAIAAAANGLVQFTDTTAPIPPVRFYRTKYVSGP